MNIIFSDLFKQNTRDLFKISESSARDVIEHPTDTQKIDYKDLSLTLYSKVINENLLILLLTEEKDGNCIVSFGFKIKPDLSKAVFIKRPINILQDLMQKYGLTVNVGGKAMKIFLSETVDLPASGSVNIINVENPQNHSFIQNFLMKVNEKEAELGLGFVLDTTEYIQWLDL